MRNATLALLLALLPAGFTRRAALDLADYVATEPERSERNG